MIDTPESFVTFFQTKQITKRKEVLPFEKTEYRNENGRRSQPRHDCRTTHALCRVTDYTVRGVSNFGKFENTLDKAGILRYTTVCKEKNFTGGGCVMEKEKSLREIDEIVELSALYDFYGALLKDNHRRIFEDYVWNNYSLSEIAVEQQITRQGVYSIINSCRVRLREYEEKLRLVDKFQRTREKLEQIEKIAGSGKDNVTAEKITALAEEIYEII